MNQITISVDDVEYVKELYPRLKPDDSTIERYRNAIGNLPPIVLARGRVLVDGYHRWQACRREGVAEIAAIDLGNLADAEIFRESITRNAAHGFQLTTGDKKLLAAKLWSAMVHLGDDRVRELATILAVAERTVREWTKEARSDEKRAAQQLAWDMWLDCHTQQQIADAVGVAQPTVVSWVSEMADVPKLIEPPESLQDFTVWKFHIADKDAGQQSYFGALAPQIMENLLYRHTKPGDVVVDMFAGSGTTIDVAKRMGRRVWASDIRGNHYSPHLPIHKWDATQGWPTDAPRKAELLFLDPPYWRQATGRYSQEPNELAEMDLDTFYATWEALLKSTAPRAAQIAYIISPTQLPQYGDRIEHAIDMACIAKSVGLNVTRRYVIPYSTHQWTGAQVTNARNNKQDLVLHRDLVVLGQ